MSSKSRPPILLEPVFSYNVAGWTPDRGDAPQLVEVESFMIADIAGVVLRRVSYEVSAFRGFCNRHAMPSDPAGRRSETGLWVMHRAVMTRPCWKDSAF